MEFNVEEIEIGFCPVKFNKYDAGFDVMSRYDITIPYLSTCCIPLGFKVYIKPGWEMQIRDRSHIVSETPLRVEDSPATIDAGYMQEITCTIFNSINPEYIQNYNSSIYINRFNDEGFQLNKGDRIAQVLFKEIPRIDLKIVNDIKKDAVYKRKIRNSKQGFGSTGINVYSGINLNEV